MFSADRKKCTSKFLSHCVHYSGWRRKGKKNTLEVVLPPAWLLKCEPKCLLCFISNRTCFVFFAQNTSCLTDAPRRSAGESDPLTRSCDVSLFYTHALFAAAIDGVSISLCSALVLEDCIEKCPKYRMKCLI